MAHGPLVRPEELGAQQPVDVLLRPLRRFLRFEAAGGILLLVMSGLALLWANSAWGDFYHYLWHETKLTIRLSRWEIAWSVGHWINDLLMAVFFLVVGLEIKRELILGELASPKKAAVPIIAAVGGMAVPAGLFAAFTLGRPELRGWGVPMATDIAFALGVLTLLGPRVPVGLKVFLTALAIVDDMGAVVVIAVFYTSAIAWGALALAAVAMAALVAMNRLGIRHLGPYLLAGLVLWGAFLSSGVHATIAGVLLALAIPSRTKINALEFSQRARALLDDFDRSETGDLLVLTSKNQQEALYALDVASSSAQAPLLRLEHVLHGPVSYVIMPLFALANAGVALDGLTGVLVDPVTIGVAAGLLIGKPGGIMLLSWLAVRSGWAQLPSGVGWRDIHGASWLAGIGFTMSLFVGSLAFGEGELLTAAKVGILLGSLVAGTVGWRLARRSAGAVAG